MNVGNTFLRWLLPRFLKKGERIGFYKRIYSNLSMIIVYECWQYLLAMGIAKVFEEG